MKEVWSSIRKKVRLKNTQSFYFADVICENFTNLGYYKIAALHYRKKENFREMITS